MFGRGPRTPTPQAEIPALVTLRCCPASELLPPPSPLPRALSVSRAPFGAACAACVAEATAKGRGKKKGQYFMPLLKFCGMLWMLWSCADYLRGGGGGDLGGGFN